MRATPLLSSPWRSLAGALLLSPFALAASGWRLPFPGPAPRIDPASRPRPLDRDGDGYRARGGGDCDDHDASVHPGASEVCDGLDNDCDGTADGPDAVGAALWYSDLDGDGYGDPATAAYGCADPGDAVADATDCDDTDGSVHPGGEDLPADGLDQDCSGDGACDTLTVLTYTPRGGGYYPLESEAEMEAFCASYNAFSGYELRVNGDISSMDGLSCLCQVDGDLSVTPWYVVDFEGLNLLTEVTGTLEFYETTGYDMISMDGFHNLTHVGDLDLGAFWALTDWSGFEKLETVDGDLGVYGFLQLEEPPEFPALISIGGTLSYESNQRFTEITTPPGLGALDTLEIKDNGGLRTATGSAGLTAIGTLHVLDNDAMTTLAGFDHVSTIDSFTVEYNASLTDLSDFDALVSVTTFFISRLDDLATLDGFDALTTVSDQMTLSQMGALTELSGFGALSSVENGLVLDDLDALPSITGFAALTDVKQGMQITDSDALVSVPGLSSLQAVRGLPLLIEHNPKLQNLDGLSGLRRVGDSLEILNNDALTDVSGPEGVRTIGTDLIITGNASLPAAEANKLYTAIGDANIAGEVTIEDNGP